jgi:hypothetical protein
MRRLLPVAGLIFALVGVLIAAEKDSQGAAHTRTKQLNAKVTVDFKDEMLGECMKELSRQLEDAGVGKLGATYDTGVSMNQRVTYAGKDQTVAEALDGMLKRASLGFYVVSKDKDRYDGWIKITRGNERGWPAGQEPKDKTAKATPPPKEKPADAPAAGDAEKTAATKLDLARSLLKDGKTDKAKQRFQDIITQFPGTKAADEAKRELEKLGK